MRSVICGLAVLVLLAATAVAQAADDDIVTLTSGNRMTGQIRGLSRGELSFRIDGVGTVSINWKNVESLQSAKALELELASGERLTATLAPGAGGKLDLQSAAGARTIDKQELIQIVRVEATALQRISGSVDLGFDYLTAGDEIDWTLNAELDHRTQNYLTRLLLDSLIRRRDSETVQDRGRIEVNTRRFLDNRWFVLGVADAEEDQTLELDSRFLVGLAYGRTLIQSNQNVLAVYGGLDYQLEDYGDVTGNRDSVELLGTVEYDWFEVDGQTEILTRTTVYYGPEESRARFNVDASLRRKFFASYYWSLNLFESYDSDPPDDRRNSSFGLSLALGRSF